MADQLYYVRAIYDFATEFPDEIRFAIGDIVLVNGKVNEEWLSGVNLHTSDAGKFPSNFTEPFPTTSWVGFDAQLIADFPASQYDELAAESGEIVRILEAQNADWCKVRNTLGSSGMMPLNFLQLTMYNEDRPVEDDGLPPPDPNFCLSRTTRSSMSHEFNDVIPTSPAPEGRPISPPPTEPLPPAPKEFYANFTDGLGGDISIPGYENSSEFTREVTRISTTSQDIVQAPDAEWDIPSWAQHPAAPTPVPAAILHPTPAAVPQQVGGILQPQVVAPQPPQQAAQRSVAPAPPAGPPARPVPAYQNGHAAVPQQKSSIPRSKTTDAQRVSLDDFLATLTENKSPPLSDEFSCANEGFTSSSDSSSDDEEATPFGVPQSHSRSLQPSPAPPLDVDRLPKSTSPSETSKRNSSASYLNCSEFDPFQDPEKQNVAASDSSLEVYKLKRELEHLEKEETRLERELSREQTEIREPKPVAPERTRRMSSLAKRLSRGASLDEPMLSQSPSESRHSGVSGTDASKFYISVEGSIAGVNTEKAVVRRRLSEHGVKETGIGVEEKREKSRELAVMELVETERAYVEEMRKCIDALSRVNIPPTSPLPDVIKNLRLVVEVNGNISKALERDSVGSVFISAAAQLESVYIFYCQSQVQFSLWCESGKGDLAVETVIADITSEFKKSIANAFSHEAILIKPVQRILKYPLLLKHILDNSTNTHRDTASLITACNLLANTAARINENKRRKDLVNKYRDGQGLGGKLKNMNAHSLSKKSSRLASRMGASLGLSRAIQDEHFELYESQFVALEKACRVLLRDASSLVDQLELMARSEEKFSVVSNYCEFGSVKYSCGGVLVAALRSSSQIITSAVVKPLEEFVSCFGAPAKLIEKRHDKLIDYSHLIGANKSGAELHSAKVDYQALNSQLLDELPSFCNLGSTLLQGCLDSLLAALSSLHHDSGDALKPLVEAAGRQSIKRSIQPSAPPSHSAASAEAMAARLRTDYPSDALYIALQDIAGNSQSQSLALRRGRLIGVVKFSDPMGSTDNWLCDDGENRGFVPRSVLQQCKPAVSDVDLLA